MGRRWRSARRCWSRRFKAWHSSPQAPSSTSSFTSGSVTNTVAASARSSTASATPSQSRSAPAARIAGSVSAGMSRVAVAARHNAKSAKLRLTRCPVRPVKRNLIRPFFVMHDVRGGNDHPRRKRPHGGDLRLGWTTRRRGGRPLGATPDTPFPGGVGEYHWGGAKGKRGRLQKQGSPDPHRADAKSVVTPTPPSAGRLRLQSPLLRAH